MQGKCEVGPSLILMVELSLVVVGGMVGFLCLSVTLL